MEQEIINRIQAALDTFHINDNSVEFGVGFRRGLASALSIARQVIDEHIEELAGFYNVGDNQ
jgi:hypothetical protein